MWRSALGGHSPLMPVPSFIQIFSGFYIKNMAAQLLEIIDLSATLYLGTNFFLIFFNLAWGDIFLDCWVTGGVVLDKVIAAQFCTLAAFSQAPG
jgi:hypothetical protein